jgi:uncharacterized protein YodC (DUF2158 family)
MYLGPSFHLSDSLSDWLPDWFSLTQETTGREKKIFLPTICWLWITTSFTIFGCGDMSSGLKGPPNIDVFRCHRVWKVNQIWLCWHVIGFERSTKYGCGDMSSGVKGTPNMGLVCQLHMGVVTCHWFDRSTKHGCVSRSIRRICQELLQVNSIHWLKLLEGQPSVYAKTLAGQAIVCIGRHNSPSRCIHLDLHQIKPLCASGDTIAQADAFIEACTKSSHCVHRETRRRPDVCIKTYDRLTRCIYCNTPIRQHTSTFTMSQHPSLLSKYNQPILLHSASVMWLS